MPLVKDEATANGARLESRAGEEVIVLSLVADGNPPPGQGPATEVGVRVATFGDQGLSERILDQIGRHFVPVLRGLVAPPPLVPAPLAPPPQTAPPPLAK